MRYVLIRVPGLAVDTARTQNVGYDYEQVVSALARLDAKGHSHELLDGGNLSDEARVRFSADATIAFTFASPRKKKGRKRRNSFGTRSQPWQDFGTGIPVLLVYDDSHCVDIYPHNESDGTVTIMEYLTRDTI